MITVKGGRIEPRHERPGEFGRADVPGDVPKKFGLRQTQASVALRDEI